jgi:molecular chaperone DnaK (HSP70)
LEDGEPVDLSELRDALEDIRNNASQEIRDEINNFITNLNEYIESPQDQNLEEFYKNYQDFIDKYGNILN